MADSSDEPAEKALEELFYPDEQVPFVDWDEFSGGRAAVVLTAVITFLAFVTGLSSLSQQTVALSGPLATVFPMAEGFARFGGILLSFPLGPVVIGLRRRKRLAWRSALVLLPALGLLPLTTLRTTDIPLLLVILVTVPLLVRNRDEFDQTIDLSPLQIASLSTILGVVVYGTVGAYGLRDQFLELDGWGDAMYYVVVTIATVGYGDITPTTPEAKWFSLSVILLGTGAFTIAVGALVGPAIESRMATAFGNMTASELTLLEDHVVVLGYGDITEPLLDSLPDGTDTVVVTPDTDVASSLDAESINVLTGDPTDESVVRDAQVETARGVVVGSHDDARDALAVLAARNVDPDVRVVAAANEEKHVEKLSAVGADRVINPPTIGGRLLSESVIDEDESALSTAAFDGGDDR